MAVQSYPKSSSTKLSKNLNSRDFHCGLGGEYWLYQPYIHNGTNWEPL